jgi:hypothetical protein
VDAGPREGVAGVARQHEAVGLVGRDRDAEVDDAGIGVGGPPLSQGFFFSRI